MLPFWPRKYYHLFVLLLFVFSKHRLRRAANSICSTEAMLPELQVPRTNWGDAECMFPMGTHTCPVPVWPAGMKAAYWKKPYTCIQMWVDPSSSQGQTFSLSSHCSHHPHTTHKHVHGGVSLVAGLDLMVPPVANVQTQWSLPCPDQAHGDLPSFWPAGPARGQQRWCTGTRAAHTSFPFSGFWPLDPLQLPHSDPIHVHQKAPSPRRRVGNSARGGDRTAGPGWGKEPPPAIAPLCSQRWALIPQFSTKPLLIALALIDMGSIRPLYSSLSTCWGC